LKEYIEGSLYLSIAMAFPIIRQKMAFSLGLQPFSNMSYSFTYDYPFDENPDESTVILNEGKGGISSFNFGIGGVVYKGLSLGVKASYLFSSYQKESSSSTSAAYPSYIAKYVQRQSAGGFLFQGGAAYKQKIGDYELSLGLIYDIPRSVDGKEFIRFEQRTLNNQIFFADTLVNNEPNKLAVPTTLGGGVSFGKPEKWVVGFDYKQQDWSGLNANDGFIRNFTKSKKYILGGENINYSDFFKTIKEVSGKTIWMIQFPVWAMLIFAELNMMFTRIFGFKPFITPALVKKFNYNWIISSKKAFKDLGYNITSFKKGVELTLNWINSNNI
jgi:hypothetical protein